MAFLLRRGREAGAEAVAGTKNPSQGCCTA